MKLTDREKICLEYLSNKMEATARMCGHEIYDRTISKRGGSNLSAIGSNVLGALAKRGLVLRVPELKAWQISIEGRKALKESFERVREFPKEAGE